MNVTLRTPRVLLVDDDLDTREMYSWSLEARGFRVTAASNAINALAEAGADPPDIVVTDFVLPGMDGLELTRRLREVRETAAIPVVLLTGRDLTGDGASDALRVCERILLKPVLPDQLADDILRMVTVRTAERLRGQVAEVKEKLALAGATGRGSTAADGARAIIDTVAEVLGDSSASAAAFVADDGARYVELNEEACAMTGRSRREILSLLVWDLTPNMQISSGKRMWAEFLQRGTLEGPYSVATPAGRPVSTWFSAAANVLPGLHLALLTPMPAPSGEAAAGL